MFQELAPVHFDFRRLPNSLQDMVSTAYWPGASNRSSRIHFDITTASVDFVVAIIVDDALLAHVILLLDKVFAFCVFLYAFFRR